ncbi:MAG: YigZ family protein [Syntrophomonas sp.]
MFYKTIGEIVSSEIIIKNSRFICLLVPINHPQNVEQALNEARSKYPGANHYCFAYILTQGTNMGERCSDDGEPSGTAGLPMLNILKKLEFQNVLAIVIRYFGGTLLGTGGLIKAYNQAVQTALDKTIPVIMEYSKKLILSCSYSQYGAFQKELSNHSIQITHTDYSDLVNIEMWIPVNALPHIVKLFDNISAGTSSVVFLEEAFVQKSRSL